MRESMASIGENMGDNIQEKRNRNVLSSFLLYWNILSDKAEK